jgi:hypothetical protein
MDSRRLIVPFAIVFILTGFHSGYLARTGTTLLGGYGRQREADSSPLFGAETLVFRQSFRESSFTFGRCLVRISAWTLAIRTEVVFSSVVPGKFHYSASNPDLVLLVT